jgi:macrolide-specific efflux system membrane fusion protein
MGENMTDIPQKRKWLKPLLGVALVGALAVGTAPYLLPAPQGPQFVTAKAARMDMEESVMASGTLEAIKQVSVGAQVSGQVKSLKVALGDKVTKGQ